MNKMSLALIVTVLFSNMAFAAVNIFGGYDMTTSSLQKTNGVDVMMNHTGGLYVGAEFVEQLTEIFAFDAGAAYYFDRTIDSCTISSGTCSISNPKPAIGAFVIYGDLRYNISEKLYVKGGLNYNSSRSTASGTTATAKLGLQGGVGYKVVENITVEGNYHIFNADLKTGSSTADFSNSGIDVALKYAI